MIGLLDFGTWHEVNRFHSNAGMVRGRHFHKYTTEAFIMIQGSVRITLQRVVGGCLTGEAEVVHASAGDVFLIEPNINHTFEVLEACAWLNLLDRKLDDAEPDLHHPAGE